MGIKQISLDNNLYTIVDRYLKEQIARKFDSSDSYNIRDFCIYNNQLYQCIEDCSGDWDNSCWEIKKITDLDREKNVIYYIDNLIDDTIFNSILEKNITSIEKSDIKQIKGGAFQNCSSLQSVNIPQCSSIGDYAFASCSSLQSISFSQCTSIGNDAFRSCTLLQSVSFPQCSSIGGYAFYSCSSLQSVNFPQCTSISDHTFYSCISLQSVSFPQCTAIGSEAFYNCTSLQSVSFPQCTSIDSYAFLGCTSLQSIYLLAPSICTLITSLAFLATPIQDLSYLGHFGSIYVPLSLVDAYKSATNWTYYSSRIIAFEGVIE